MLDLIVLVICTLTYVINPIINQNLFYVHSKHHIFEVNKSSALPVVSRDNPSIFSHMRINMLCYDFI